MPGRSGIITFFTMKIMMSNSVCEILLHLPGTNFHGILLTAIPLLSYAGRAPNPPQRLENGLLVEVSIY
jgi:hypothetical protein